MLYSSRNKFITKNVPRLYILIIFNRYLQLIFYLGLSEVSSHQNQNYKPEPMIFPTQLVPRPKNPFSDGDQRMDSFSDGDTSVLPEVEVYLSNIPNSSFKTLLCLPHLFTPFIHMSSASVLHQGHTCFCMFMSCMSCKFLPLGFSCSGKLPLLLPTPPILTKCPVSDLRSIPV